MKINEHFANNSKYVKAVLAGVNKNWVVSVCNKGTLLLIGASLVAIALRWNSLPREVPFWYARVWGEDRLAAPIWLILLPLGSFLWHILNSIVATFVTRDYLVFTQLLFITSLVVSLLSFITLTKILLLVG